MTASVHSLDQARREREHRAGTEAWSTKQQVAEHLGFSVRWVEMRVSEGLPCRRMGGRLRFQLTACEHWLAEQERDRTA